MNPFAPDPTGKSSDYVRGALEALQWITGSLPLIADIREQVERLRAAEVPSAAAAPEQSSAPDSALITALRSYTQADEEGVFVNVSRQACEEAADLIESQRSELLALTNMLALCGEPECRDVEGYPAKLRALIDGVINLRASLRTYGRHLDSCGDADAHNHADMAMCGCGFDAALLGVPNEKVGINPAAAWPFPPGPAVQVNEQG